MELQEGSRRILAGILFLATSISLFVGFATWLMGTPFDTRLEKLTPVAFFPLALLLAKVFTWIIRRPESGSVSEGQRSRVTYSSVLGYATLVSMAVWLIVVTCRLLFPSLR
jgi:hypothetical protein